MARHFHYGEPCEGPECNRKAQEGVLCSSHAMQMRTRGYLTPLYSQYNKAPLLPGEKFGRLTIVSGPLPNPNEWTCQKSNIMAICDCGAMVIASRNHIRKGLKKSCGCLWSEYIKTPEFRAQNKTHGFGKHPLYGTWNQMRHRCHDPKHSNYSAYGGRGISVYEPWREDVAAFINWITANLGTRPEGYSLDRIDVDGNYEPGNLRWADRFTQAANQRRVLALVRVGELEEENARLRTRLRELGDSA